MKRNKLQRIISIILISTVLFWTAFPVVGYASFITPGQAINPGQAITPGEPISGGQFIAPGDVYDYGSAIEGGQNPGSSNNWNSGQPIIQADPLTGGVFITPNAPWQPSFVQFGSTPINSGTQVAGGETGSVGNSVEAGNGGANGSAVTGGNSSNNGNATNDGQAIAGGDGSANGNGVDSGNAVDSGQGGANGNAVDGGSGSGDGSAVNGGNPNGPGNGINGGNTGNNGATINGQGPFATGNTPLGNGLLTGGSTNGNPTNGNATSGNPANGGNAADSGENTTSFLNAAFGTTNDSKGLFSQVTGFLGDAKRYVFGFADNVAQGAASIYAGFKFKELADGKYSVYGKNQLNNGAANWLYDRYRQYSFDGDDVQFGPNSRRIGDARYNAFLQSKNIGGAGSMFSNVASSTKSALNSSWNVLSSSFWKPSNMAKLGGPVGVALTSIGSIHDHSSGFSDLSGLKTTDFAASLTTDVAIGVASTAVGSMASSAAAGALAGSVVPGVGTIVGAGVGLLAGVATTYLINGTPAGRRVKQAVTDTVKKGYDGVVKGAKWAADGISSGLSKIGGLFGG
ncbi:hypothetical protein [Saliterribacillus persicus]|uniref:Uncharacterized protein n=1 Tax=Saliterribacillus persicus TaxID=930114 RepID=A0A368XFN8_9BACI|nr:hypothetical protein [Saliterribacillus persicus]RCW65838.1 hypothetical protein DFR57_11055 [Saliterribacillus persicus]